MKKTATALALALSLNVAAPAPKAHAGCYYTSRLFESHHHGSAWLLAGASFGLLGLFIELEMRVLGVIVFVLDAEASKSPDQIARGLSTKYTFVDNAETFGDLASLIASKAPAELTEKGTYVSIDKDETRAALESANLTPEQIEIIATDLN